MEKFKVYHKTLAKIYCQVVQSNADKLWVITGAWHVNGLIDLLDEASSGKIKMMPLTTIE